MPLINHYPRIVLNEAPLLSLVNLLTRAEKDAAYGHQSGPENEAIARANIAATKAAIVRRFPAYAERQNDLCRYRNSHKMGLQRLEPVPFPAVEMEWAA